MKRPKPRPPLVIETPLTVERRWRATLSGWVVGWGGLFLDDDGFLGLREDARVFPSWWRAALASFFFLWGWPRRTGPRAQS